MIVTIDPQAADLGESSSSGARYNWYVDTTTGELVLGTDGVGAEAGQHVTLRFTHQDAAKFRRVMASVEEAHTTPG